MDSSEALGTLFWIIAIPIYIWHKISKANNIKQVIKNSLNVSKKKIENNEKISWSKFFDFFNGETYKKNEDILNISENRTIIQTLISQGISKELFFGEVNKTEYAVLFEDFIRNETLKYVDNLALELSINEYSFVDVNRSSYSGIEAGNYIYEFKENDSLVLLKTPIYFEKLQSGFLTLFDSNNINKTPIIIKREEIKDFQIFGTQLNQTDINMTNQGNSKLSTMFSESIFGPSYTILNGLSKITLNSTHSINDARVVQVMLIDKTDIELRGISIYFDFNRRYGNIKNKENELVNKHLVTGTKHKLDETKSDLNYIEEFKRLKELYDHGLITLEEYNLKKKKLLEI